MTSQAPFFMFGTLSLSERGIGAIASAMKLSDATIVISPGFGGQTDNHWQRRWTKNMKTAVYVDHESWLAPQKDHWVADIVAKVEAASNPVVLVGHSLGVIAITHAAQWFTPDKVRGAFLVCPSDWERPDLVDGFDGGDFKPIPMQRLPFPTQMIASRNDPFCTFERSLEFSEAWGASLIDAGEAGHITENTGQGPWPEGLTAFALFMKSL